MQVRKQQLELDMEQQTRTRLPPRSSHPREDRNTPSWQGTPTPSIAGQSRQSTQVSPRPIRAIPLRKIVHSPWTPLQFRIQARLRAHGIDRNVRNSSCNCAPSAKRGDPSDPSQTTTEERLGRLERRNGSE